MYYRSMIGAIAGVAALAMTTGAQAFDETKYPNLKGEWRRVAVSTGAARVIQYDPSKQPGLAQEAPLKPEYRAILEANIADHAQGGQAGDATALCLAPGMPRVMGAYSPMEIVVTPETTYILIEHIHDSRRIHTDGRDFPPNMELDPQFSGYSIGRWVDEDGDGRYDTRWSRPVASKVRAPTRRPASRFTRTMRPSSPSASISTRAMPTCCTMRSPSSTTR